MNSFTSNKASAEVREAVLNWIGMAMIHNSGRTKLQADRRATSSDGFLLNVAAILLELCSPFLDPKANKVRPRLIAFC